VWYEIVTGQRLQIGKGHAIVGMFGLYLINYFIFLHNGRYLAIIKKIATESQTQKRRGMIWCWTYVLGTYLTFLISVIWLAPGKG
jgi:hypothetical protein